MARVTEYLKNILLVIIILQFLPMVFITAKKYLGEAMHPKASVGVISIKGVIANTGQHIKYARKFFKDSEIKAIILKIDSQGGSPGAAQALYREIMDLKKEYEKPVIAYIEEVCASAAYNIAIAADHIICQPSSLVGSIGAYIAFPSFQGIMDDYHVKYQVIESGSMKMGGSVFKDLGPEQQKMLQAVTDDTYKQFASDVMERRPKLTTANEASWGDGKVFTGNMALNVGLVDEIGSLSALIRAIRDKAAIETDIEWVHPPKPGFLQQFAGRSDYAEFDEPEAQAPITLMESLYKQISTGYPYSWQRGIMPFTRDLDVMR